MRRSRPTTHMLNRSIGLQRNLDRAVDAVANPDRHGELRCVRGDTRFEPDPVFLNVVLRRAARSIVVVGAAQVVGDREHVELLRLLTSVGDFLSVGFDYGMEDEPIRPEHHAEYHDARIVLWWGWDGSDFLHGIEGYDAVAARMRDSVRPGPPVVDSRPARS
jgi:hypothetical protein